jgi:hypothetical protein
MQRCQAQSEARKCTGVATVRELRLLVDGALLVVPVRRCGPGWLAVRRAIYPPALSAVRNRWQGTQATEREAYWPPSLSL